MIKAITVDDEWYNLEEISDLIDATGIIKVIKKYQNPVKALEEVEELLPEVAFIDVEMYEIDGITLARSLREKIPEILIIFVTSWEKYAIHAFDLDAVDYILKPIRMERFVKTIEKISSIISKNAAAKSARLKIQCFDKLKVSIDGAAVRWERAKAEELFAFLLLNHGDYVHKDVIIDNLWENHVPSKALPILQTSVSRIRSIFSELHNEVILDYNTNKYCLTVVDGWCDYLEAKKALDVYQRNQIDTYKSVENAARISAAGLLAEQGYLWAQQKEVELRNRLTLVLEEIAAHYRYLGSEGDLSRVMKLINKMMYNDDED